MQINTDNSSGFNPQLIKPHHQTDESAPKTHDAQITPVQQEETSEPKKSAQGVLRLLEAGHFKGVADVRLRINFHDQLTQKANEAAKDELQSGSQDLVSLLNDTVQNTLATVDGVDLHDEPDDYDQHEVPVAELPEVPDSELHEEYSDDDLHEAPIDDLLLQFSDTINTAVNDVISGAGLDLNSIETAFTAAFEELTFSIQELLGSSEVNVTPGENVDVIDDSTITTPVATSDDSTLKQALEDLSDIFTNALSDLLASVESISLLPDPIPATGNGAAYEKFLAQYDQLRFSEPQIDISA